MKKLFTALILVSLSAATAIATTFNEVKNQGKPVVVMFHMHGCGACKQFSPVFDKFASKFSDKFNFVKEDINHSDIAKSLNFQTVPAIFIIEPNTMKATRVGDNCAWDEGCFTDKLSKY